ncbi:MAG: hypothetical protein QNJ72_43450 [Pleurocapsa sp. MO_226.B13]|nr:hypothetical protein [Pleurocapsa sp. MO_226.B13]
MATIPNSKNSLQKVKKNNYKEVGRARSRVKGQKHPDRSSRARLSLPISHNGGAK